MSETEDLMQPGNTTWRDEAKCLGDERFIDPTQTVGLGQICATCPVFSECSQWAKGKNGVFAAGRWRSIPQEQVEPWHGKCTGSNP